MAEMEEYEDDELEQEGETVSLEDDLPDEDADCLVYSADRGFFLAVLDVNLIGQMKWSCNSNNFLNFYIEVEDDHYWTYQMEMEEQLIENEL